MKKFGEWFKGLTDTKQALFIVAILITLFTVGGALSPNTTNTADKQPATTQTHQPEITTKTVTETQVIAFGNKTVKSSSLAKGTKQITTAGMAGKEKLTYKITYSDGVQISKKLIKTEVTKQPITQVVTIGTYVAPAASSSSASVSGAATGPSCPNGTYVNSSGNTVCRPYASSSAPAGATAKCVDGTYSFSQHHSGTCSHHGGVAQWL